MGFGEFIKGRRENRHKKLRSIWNVILKIVVLGLVLYIMFLLKEGRFTFEGLGLIK